MDLFLLLYAEKPRNAFLKTENWFLTEACVQLKKKWTFGLKIGFYQGIYGVSTAYNLAYKLRTNRVQTAYKCEQTTV